MLNIVLPMAGAGSRFAAAGFEDPKPLIPVLGMPMIELVIRNLTPSRPHRFIFIAQRLHADRYDLAARLREWAPGSILLEIDGVTDGAARTALVASEYINDDRPLLIANSDQFVDASIDDYLADLDDRDLDGSIMTMRSDDPKWSFVALDPAGAVERVVEKVVISDRATVGIYSFARGRDFVSAALEMIRREQLSNGEYYVAPVYNVLIAEGASIGAYDVGAPGAGMHGLGTPADLAEFVKLDVARRAVVGHAHP